MIAIASLASASPLIRLGFFVAAHSISRISGL